MKQKDVVKKALVAAGVDRDLSLSGVIKGALDNIGKKVVGNVAEDLSEELSKIVVAFFEGNVGKIRELYSSIVNPRD
ncbi:MAG: hypothetical protein IPF59_13895 [Ignavibacteria bacterium]|nr:hypothetical protein [Ignavibacteria bacterium]